MNKKIFKIIILANAFFLFCFFSCTNDDFDLNTSICEVNLSGFLQPKGKENNFSELKIIRVDRGDAPNNVKGYTLKVENIDYQFIETINKTYQFKSSSNYGNGMVSDVTEGLNRFTVESYGGRTYHGWKSVSWAYGVDEDEIADDYSRLLEEEYPRYSIYKDVVEANISPDIINEVRFNMEPVNGRLAVVIENNKYNHKVLVYVNKEKKKVIRYDNVFCYLLNDNSPDGTELNFRILIKKGKTVVKTINRNYILKSGIDRTRYINIE